MRAKSVTLYSLPYLVAAASLVVAVHQAIPSFKTWPSLSSTSAKNEIFFDQSVNRSLKGDRLPIEHTAPQATEKGPVSVPIPIVPTRKTVVI